MKTAILLCLLALLFGCAAPEKTSAPAIPNLVAITEQGKSCYSIVLPAKASPAVMKLLREGAAALQSAIRESSGVHLPIVLEKECCSRKECSNIDKGIYLGNCRAAAEAGLDSSAFAPAEYVIAERSGSIFIMGKDLPAAPGKKKRIANCSGTLNGIVGFMEQILRTRILYPGEIGRTTPRSSRITIEKGITLRVKAPQIPAGRRRCESIFDAAGNRYSPAFGLEGPLCYVRGARGDGFRQNQRKRLREFCQYAFGAGAPQMLRFYKMLYAVDSVKGRLQLPQNAGIQLTTVLTPGRMETMEYLLQTAERNADTYKAKRRLQLVRSEFDELKNLAVIFHHYHSYRLSPDWSGFEKIARAMEQRSRIVKASLDPKGKKKFMSSWPEMPVKGNIDQAVILPGSKWAPPFTWNIQALRRSRFLPEASKRQISVPLYRKGALKDPDKGAWQRVPYIRLEGVQTENVKYKTWFKMMYDQKNIYLAFKAELPSSRSYKLPAGRDKAVVSRDCLELFLSPAAERRDWYHFLWNPLQGVTSESLRKQARSPFFNRNWNGKWQCRTFRKGNTWYTVLTIPHAVLKASAPGKGTRWHLNIVRRDHAAPGSAPVFSLWSPNLENKPLQAFRSPGTVIFR